MKIGKMIIEVLRSLLKKPATNLYPAQKLDMAKDYRGRLKFYPQMCIGCKLCMKDCPSGAITITKTAEGKFEAEIDLGKCIYCGQCAGVCPKKALEITQEIELAQLDIKNLKIVFK